MKKLRFYRLLRQRILQYKRELVKNNQGQTLLEFLFLFVILITLSFVFLTSINGYVGNRWTAFIKVISKPTATIIELN